MFQQNNVGMQFSYIAVMFLNISLEVNKCWKLTDTVLFNLNKMNDIQFYILFNSISVISRR